MKRSMTRRSYLGWQRYWEEEPWGPWRDNFHSALIAREVRRGIPGAGSRSLDKFMYRRPAKAIEEAETKVLSTLSMMAQAVTPEEAARRIAKGRKRQRAR